MLATNTYQRMRGMTERRLALIEDGGLGSELVIKRKVSQYNPTTKRTETTETVYTTSGLRNNYRLFDTKNTSIQDTDVNFYVHPVCKIKVPDPDWVPDVDLGETEADRPLIDQEIDTPQLQPTDVITFLATNYTVVNSKPWNHAGVLIGYKVQGRVV